MFVRHCDRETHGCFEVKIMTQSAVIFDLSSLLSLCFIWLNKCEVLREENIVKPRYIAH